MPEPALHFTQTDRDMLRDTNGDVKRIAAALEKQDLKHAEHDKRIASVERWQTRFGAVAAFVGFMGGLAARVFGR